MIAFGGKRAKIVCTIGPASQNEQMLENLALAGMDVARLNFSHGTHQSHLKSINLIRKVSQKTGKPIAILIDLQGPKIRIGTFKEGPVTLNQGDRFTITTENVPGDQQQVSTGYTHLPKDVKAGDRILINDGLIQLQVVKTDDVRIETEVVIGGILYDRKGINLPGVVISEPSLTEKDKKDLLFGLKNGADYVALSFVRDARSIRHLKEFMGKDGIPVIAKLEKPEAINNLDDILAESDVVMVARGDLGVEISPEKVPAVQKMIIEKCQYMGVPVITATQMLDSMMNNPVPTRAEASDVANAIYDGTDAVMLSGETAFGKYPLQSVKMMSAIIEQSEKTDYSRVNLENMIRKKPLSSSRSICHVATVCAEEIGAKYIVVFTESGFTAKIMSKYRPDVPVLALTRHARTLNKLALFWGAVPSKIEQQISIMTDLTDLENHLKKARLVKSGDKLVIIAGSSLEEGATNMLRLHRVL